MSGSSERIHAALAHERPDRTPLFEIFQPYHPIHWPICGHTIATDMAMAWDAMADGVAWRELVDAQVDAEFAVCRFFGLDMVRLNGAPPRDYVRPVKTGPDTWTRNGVPYWLNPRTCLVEQQNPADNPPPSDDVAETALRRQLEAWAESPVAPQYETSPVYTGVRERAQAEGLDWAYMGGSNAGTMVAGYRVFQLMWLVTEPDLIRQYLAMHLARQRDRIRGMVADGYEVIALGGDVSCDKGPFLSPAHYREFILPVIREQVGLIHSLGAHAVYTSDGNHWPIRDAFFFDTGIDGYKEVDKAAGMTWPRLIEEGVADRVCIVGNIDARHMLCHGTPDEVRAEVIECLRYGQTARGGHILHASHSVHEDVKADNYHAAVAAYRDFFRLPPL